MLVLVVAVYHLFRIQRTGFISPCVPYLSPGVSLFPLGVIIFLKSIARTLQCIVVNYSIQMWIVLYSIMLIYDY